MSLHSTAVAIERVQIRRGYLRITLLTSIPHAAVIYRPTAVYVRFYYPTSTQLRVNLNTLIIVQ